MLTLSEKERKLFDLATIKGLTIEEAYAKTYGTKSRKILVTNIARKQKRSPLLFDEINKFKSDLFEKAKADQRNAILKVCSENALTIAEKREILRKIITGETKGEDHVVVKGEVKRIIRSSSIHEKLRAIELDCKIAGHFAPLTLQHDGSDKFLEFLRDFADVSNQGIPQHVQPGFDKH